MSDDMIEDVWQVFDLPELMTLVSGTEPKIREFLRTSGMSLSIYHLPVGAIDMQAPHYEDEVYVVLSGMATLRIDDDERQVSRGSVLFVKATTSHSFFDITEDLTVLAIFGGAL
ncbi:MAG: cupin domain-containing protein [Pseudomonadota bacterium]